MNTPQIEDSEDEEFSSLDFLCLNTDQKLKMMDRQFDKLSKMCNLIDDSKHQISKHILEKAKKLYLKGMIFEKNNNINDALTHYKKAVHIVPDIDVRVEKSLSLQQSDLNVDLLQYNKPFSTQNLISKFSNLLEHESNNMEPCDNDNNYGISLYNLPKELLLRIIECILDTQSFSSLFAFSKVCKKFYVCSRDEQIWYKVYYKLWGAYLLKTRGIILSTANPNLFGHNCWMKVALFQPCPRFDGCYISKSSYWRYGQSDFCDDFSSLPCYSIKYYRYMKFFPPSGQQPTRCTIKAPSDIVLILNSVEPPNVVLPKLINYKLDTTFDLGSFVCAGIPSLMIGSYYLSSTDPLKEDGNDVNINNNQTQESTLNKDSLNPNDEITLIVNKKRLEVAGNYVRRGRRQMATTDGKLPKKYTTSTFYMKFTIKKNHKGQPNRKLCWKHYSLFIKYSNGNKSKTIFDLTEDYPPLTFVSNYMFSSCLKK